MARDIYIGVDLGGTITKIAAGDAQGKILAEKRMPTASQNGPQDVLHRIAREAKRLCQRSGTAAASLGIGVPGVVDIHQGVTRYLPNFPTHWPDLPVAALLQKEMGCPVHLLNDVKAATLGEMVFGLGRGAKSMVFFAIGTGVGGGIVIDGLLHLGPIGSAGELGHILVENDGPRCGCGSRGCLETIVSGPALAAEGVRLMLSGQAPLLFELAGGDAGKVDARLLGQAAEQGEQSALAAIRRAGYYLGLAISHLIVALQPELIVLGGGVAGLGEPLFGSVRSTVRETVRIYPSESYRIERSTVEGGAGLMGALALAIRGGVLPKPGTL